MNFILVEETFILNEKQMNIKRKKYVNPPDTRQLNNIGISVNKKSIRLFSQNEYRLNFRILEKPNNDTRGTATRNSRNSTTR